MKYIVLSFDDGFSDFKYNALPILNKYNFKSTIAVVSGYVDNTFLPSHECMNLEDLRELVDCGHELALHSDSHPTNLTIDDILVCKKKMTDWFGNQNFGFVIPYSQKINETVVECFKNEKMLYFADYKSYKHTNLSFAAFRVFNHFFHSKKGDFLVESEKYIYTKNDILSEVPSFQRLPILNKNDVQWYIDFIKRMKNETCVTLMFHSITSGLEQTEWNEGAVSVRVFEDLLCFLKKYNKCVVLTQKELIKSAKFQKKNH